MARELIFILIYCLSLLALATVVTLFILRKDRHSGFKRKDLKKIRKQTKKRIFPKK